jgi:hypothetical protein
VNSEAIFPIELWSLFVTILQEIRLTEINEEEERMELSRPARDYLSGVVTLPC